MPLRSPLSPREDGAGYPSIGHQTTFQRARLRCRPRVNLRRLLRPLVSLPVKPSSTSAGDRRLPTSCCSARSSPQFHFQCHPSQPISPAAAPSLPQMEHSSPTISPSPTPSYHRHCDSKLSPNPGHARFLSRRQSHIPRSANELTNSSILPCPFTLPSLSWPPIRSLDGQEVNQSLITPPRLLAPTALAQSVSRQFVNTPTRPILLIPSQVPCAGRARSPAERTGGDVAVVFVNLSGERDDHQLTGAVGRLRNSYTFA